MKLISLLAEDMEKTQSKLRTDVPVLRTRIGKPYKHLYRFLKLMKWLSFIAIFGAVGNGMELGRAGILPETGAIILAVVSVIYTWIVSSVVQFLRPLVDVAVSSSVNEALIQENTDYL